MIEESSSSTDISPTMPLDKRETLCLVVVGKSGTGKSTLCNHLAGANYFEVGKGLSSCTTKPQERQVTDELVVVDTSDNTQEVVSIKKQLLKENRKKVVIVFCIRCDTRFAVDEYSIYKELKDRWGDEADFCQRLIVAFTHGDKLDGDPNQALREMLKETWPQLQAVVRDSHDRFVVFRKQEKGKPDSRAVTDLLKKAWDLNINYVPQTFAKRQEGCLPTGNHGGKKPPIKQLLVTVFFFLTAVLSIVKMCIVALLTCLTSAFSLLFRLYATYIIFPIFTKIKCLLNRQNRGNLLA